MGTPEYGERILDRLLKSDNIEVVGVVTQPDKPVGRKQIITPPPVKKRVQGLDIPIFQPHRAIEIVGELKQLNPDFIVVAAYGQILKKEILEIAPSINLHTSILPKYRGASPIQQALLNGDKVTGVTAMLMNEGLDEGDILGFYQIEIEEDWNVEELYQKLTDMAGELILDILERYSDIVPLPQNSIDSSYCPKIRKQDGLVDFSDIDILIRKFRAFTPWPSIYLDSGLKLLDIEPHNRNYSEAGRILEIGDDYILVGCSNGVLKIREVQPKSKKRMDIRSYLNGKRLKVGDIFF